MVRAPCCEKTGLKKGPWTPEEDQILISYIQQHGHGNWRALPKQAGLLRCGKSCRLRWTNYLRPDIKRGNFTREEEETIIKLHQMLGNRWSAIAARLAGRTDNEIKNVWHTHLKKRLNRNNAAPTAAITTTTQERHAVDDDEELSKTGSGFVNLSNPDASAGHECRRTTSPEHCSSSDVSSITIYDDHSNITSMKGESSDEFLEMDENFWSEVLSSDNSRSESEFSVSSFGDSIEPAVQYGYNSSMYGYDSMDFWYNLMTRSEESFDLSEI